MTAHRRPGQLAVDPADGKAGETGASPAPATGKAGGTGRRRFLGYLLAGPTLMAAAPLGGTLLAPSKASAASASVPSNPQVADTYDLNDALTDAAMPTSN